MYSKEQVNLLLLQMHSMIFEYQHAGKECNYSELCEIIGFNEPSEEEMHTHYHKEEDNSYGNPSFEDLNMY